MGRDGFDNEPRRSSFSFTELYHFGKIVGSCFSFGLTVVICSEIYLAFSGTPRPPWLDPLESFYGAVWNVTKGVASAAFKPREAGTIAADPPSAASVDPRCSVSLVQFKADGTEAARFSLNAGSLIVLPDVVQATALTWQKVRTQGDPAHAYEGWVIKPDFEAKHARPECK